MSELRHLVVELPNFFLSLLVFLPEGLELAVVNLNSPMHAKNGIIIDLGLELSVLVFQIGISASEAREFDFCFLFRSAVLDNGRGVRIAIENAGGSFPSGQFLDAFLLIEPLSFQLHFQIPAVLL